VRSPSGKADYRWARAVLGGAGRPAGTEAAQAGGAGT
jgi:hypothetical protein